VRETSWRTDGMVGGYLDAAQMPSGMPPWLTLGTSNRPVPRHCPDNDSQRITQPNALRPRVYVGRLKEMLHNTPAQHTMGWYIHPPCTLLLRYWPPVALILTGRSLEDYSPAQWWWICKPEALMVTVWGTLEPPGRN